MWWIYSKHWMSMISQLYFRLSSFTLAGSNFRFLVEFSKFVTWTICSSSAKLQCTVAHNCHWQKQSIHGFKAHPLTAESKSHTVNANSLVAKVNRSRHVKSKSFTAKLNHSRQKQITHGKSKSLTARANRSRQKHIANSLTAKANRSRHDKSKSFSTKANHPRPRQITHGKSKSTQMFQRCFHPSEY